MAKIEVNTIDTISGSTNLTIGSTNSSTVTFENGSCTGQNFPAFFAYKSTGTQSISASTYTKVTFDAELYDTDSAFASNKFTVPSGKAGIYCISGQVRDDFENGYTRQLAIYKNGSILARSREQNLSTTRHYTVVSANVRLAASDYIELYIEHNSTGARNIDGTAELETRLMGYRIGS